MIKGIYDAARSLQEKMKNLEVVANNLANINTTGYKRQVPFSEVISKAGQVQLNQFTDYRQGENIQTADPMNAAITGNGFFVLQTENGLKVTRNGSFKISQDGFLVNQDGYKVMGRNGAINLSDFMLDNNSNFQISKSGELRVGKNDVDSLMIVQLTDPQLALRDSGSNFDAGGSSYKVADTSQYQVEQGYLEQSNVNPIQEMQQMIQLNSDFNSAHKMINYLDKSLDEANQIGRV
jgi:flagellar basal-body rod protein FlgG